MGQMMGMGGGGGMSPGDTSVGYSPEGPIGQASGPSSGGTPLGPGPAGGVDAQSATQNMQDNTGLLSKVSNLFGKDQKEREKNAKAFAALVKDVGDATKTLGSSTLMQRMMTEQMRAPMAIVGGGGASGGVAAIPRSFDPGAAAASMSRAGFK